jgi:hypothetical protein
LEKDRLEHNLRPSDYKPDTLPLHPYSEVSVASIMRLSHCFFSYWQKDFPSAGFSGRICFYWLGFSGRFCCYWPHDFPTVSVVACWDFPALTFPAWESKKSPSRD